MPLLRSLRGVLGRDGRLLVQTLHPWAACGDGPYVEGWRDEPFAAFGNEPWKPMPWYFRTLEGWLALFADAGFRLTILSEPLDPETGRPLSLLMVLDATPM